MSEFLMHGPLCTLVYEHNEWDTDYGPVQQAFLKRCIPNEGIYLFEVCATYAKRIPPSTYYYLGACEKDVRERFAHLMGWMTATSVRLIPPGDEAERILTNMYTMPI